MPKSINCPCGGHYQPAGKTRHFKTKIHQKWAKVQSPDVVPKGKEKVSKIKNEISEEKFPEITQLPKMTTALINKPKEVKKFSYEDDMNEYVPSYVDIYNREIKEFTETQQETKDYLNENIFAEKGLTNLIAGYMGEKPEKDKEAEKLERIFERKLDSNEIAYLKDFIDVHDVEYFEEQDGEEYKDMYDYIDKNTMNIDALMWEDIEEKVNDIIGKFDNNTEDDEDRLVFLETLHKSYPYEMVEDEIEKEKKTRTDDLEHDRLLEEEYASFDKVFGRKLTPYQRGNVYQYKAKKFNEKKEKMSFVDFLKENKDLFEKILLS